MSIEITPRPQFNPQEALLTQDLYHMCHTFGTNLKFLDPKVRGI